MSDIEKTLRNLGVLAAVKQNDKLLTEGAFFSIYVPTTLRSVFRTMYRESREQNMDRVYSCIGAAIAFVTSVVADTGDAHTQSIQWKLYLSSQTKFCKRVLEALRNAVFGLDNLIQTYHDDAAFVVKIENIKSDITDFLETTSAMQLIYLSTVQCPQLESHAIEAAQEKVVTQQDN
tara:strand:- start:340 stop:867 length:528 start_codon:yes stop_codon:yes gene_type:complete